MKNKLDNALGQQINLAIFPARVSTKNARAKAAKGYEHSTSKNISTVPIADNAYARTLRYHEALHQIFTGRLEDLPVADAVEDARLHLICSNSKGQVRRDEVYSALLELRNVKRFSKDGAGAALVRSAAILRRGCTDRERKLWLKAVKWYAEYWLPVQDPPKEPDTRMADFVRAVKYALEALERKDDKNARKVLSPYFSTESTKTKGGSSGEDSFSSWLSSTFQWDSKEKLELALVKGRITNSSTDLMQPDVLKALQHYVECNPSDVPKMNVHEIYNIASKKTFTGPTEKTAYSGTKIRAKKLATVVGPTQPRIFIRKIKRADGGAVLIDASGSMSLRDNVIIAVAEALPFGTIAYYSAESDACYPGCYGNLVIYADKGKRYNPLGGINQEKLPLHHYGNLIDLMAIQWLLKQPGPRYLVSDGGFTGDTALARAATDLANNGAARKLLQWHRNLGSLLKQLNIEIAGVTKT